VATPCTGKFYRNEPGFLLQGEFECMGKLLTKVVKGECPSGTAVDAARECPPHDPQCGCHGPIFQPGMVGWAGGSAGPHFFIYTGSEPVTHWGHDHTVFGKVLNKASMHVVKQLQQLPAAKGGGGMLLLESPLQFTLDRANHVVGA
jgi:cyclophilin family peptidyl-prolyl cis-trans isomerase